MKLLFDANLSPKLVARIADLFPESAHVFGTGLDRFTADAVVWDYARANGFTIITADVDFIRISEKRGPPPKVVRLEKCDYRTAAVEHIIRRNAVRISELERSARSVLILRKQS